MERESTMRLVTDVLVLAAEANSRRGVRVAYYRHRWTKTADDDSAMRWTPLKDATTADEGAATWEWARA